MPESNDRREQRIAKLEQLRELGIDPYPPRIERTHTAAQALALDLPTDDQEGPVVAVAGRLMSMRVMGKSTFAHIADGTARIQLYLQRDELGQEVYGHIRKLADVGDFLAVKGTLFVTRTGETTVRAKEASIISKALRPLPEKFHGLKDVETRYRQRYLDLVANEDVRNIFVTRTRIVSAVRRFLDDQGFLEVETPILQPIYGGANASPFVTHHNALDRTLYLRIADELYLKRLIVGGLDGVYEIGHNFRNEGISTKHNPEFTAVEVYKAYADYADMMRLVEELYSFVAEQVLGTTKVSYRGNEIDLTPPWRRITMRDAILDAAGVDIAEHRDLDSLWNAAKERNLPIKAQPTWGKLVDELFGECVEPDLIQPTFIIDYPVEISPLAKRKPGSDYLVERFEYFIGGMESGNAFSELNDPIDQRERFAAQGRSAEAGDDEAHPMDEDFITALEHGMPPTGGLGFGIDRLVMLYTGQESIREVILFPQLRTK